MSILNLILDLLLVVLFIVCIVVCTRRGLIKSLFKSLRVFVSFLVAALLNNAVGGFLKAHWVKDAIHQWVFGLVSPKIEETGGAIEGLVASIPPTVKTVLGYFGFSVDEAASNAASTEEVAQNFAASVSEPLSTVISSLLAFIGVFFITFLLMIILGAVLGLIFKAPGLRMINRIGGFVVGIFSGFCWAWCLAQALVLLGTALAFVPFVAEQFSIEESIFLEFFYRFNPMQWIMAFGLIGA